MCQKCIIWPARQRLSIRWRICSGNIPNPLEQLAEDNRLQFPESSDKFYIRRIRIGLRLALPVEHVQTTIAMLGIE